MAALFGCLFGHKWNGCICSRCGKKRDIEHRFDACRGQCVLCGKKTAVEHSWRGCRCTRCAASRDEGHEFDLCRGQCTLCGKKQAPEHAWEDCLCTRCGAVRDQGHRFIPFVDDPDFTCADSPVRERCPHCGSLRYAHYGGQWEQNPLRVLLEWPGNALYVSEQGKNQICVLCADTGKCIEALHNPSAEPSVSVPDFTMLSSGSGGSLAEQLHAVFSYFAHTHNPRMGVEHLEAFGRAHGLRMHFLQHCYDVLTCKRTWEADMRNGIHRGKELEKKALFKLIDKLPPGLAGNVLHLMASRNSVSYQIEDRAEDYITVVRLSYARVDFGDANKLAAEALKERGSPVYCIEHYNEFPR